MMNKHNGPIAFLSRLACFRSVLPGATADQGNPFTIAGERLGSRMVALRTTVPSDRA